MTTQQNSVRNEIRKQFMEFYNKGCSQHLWLPLSQIGMSLMKQDMFQLAAAGMSAMDWDRSYSADQSFIDEWTQRTYHMFEVIDHPTSRVWKEFEAILKFGSLFTDGLHWMIGNDTDIRTVGYWEYVIYVMQECVKSL